MRELERESFSDDPARRPSPGHAPHTLAIVGRGRLGSALATALEAGTLDLPDGQWQATGPHGRGYSGQGATAVLLCVPDRELADAAAHISPGPMVGHCSGACPLDSLRPHEAFSVHPLMTVVPGRTSFVGAGAAVAGSTPRALGFATALARILGMRPIPVAEEDRPAYHAAASIASNFLITLETAAERLSTTAGVERELLAPLVRAALENWIEVGGERSLTGPVARGDEETVAAQRRAIAERTPDLLSLFDALTEATRALAGRGGTGKCASQSGEPPAMTIVRTIAETRELAAEARRRGQKIGLVPTMGAFHEGHLSLMRRARAECDLVVVSLFVNPTQFNDPGDLEAYPRDESRDARMAAQTGVDVLFAPPAEEVYRGGFATRVSVGDLGQTLEGTHRGPEHFEAVAMIVAKLLNIVAPDAAYFGQKDAQQVAVIKRLVRDLDLPVSIEVCPTIRAPDGLALSSRNVRLSDDERGRATALYRALSTAELVIAGGERDPVVVAGAARQELSSDGIEPDYFELVDPETFTPIGVLEGDVLAVVAAPLGTTRLIDNLPIHVPAAPARASHNTIVATNTRALELPARPVA